MENAVSSNTVYYLAIYAIVLVVRFFKTYKTKTDWREYFFVGLEFVYSSVGILILVLAYSKTYLTGAIITVFCLLLITSAFLDASDEKFSIKQRFIGHLIIIIFVVASATYFNETIIFNQERNKQTIVSRAEKQTYNVAIPYYDLSFRAYVGDKLGTRKLVYIATVSAYSSAQAVSLAKAKFWDKSNSDVTPIDVKKQKSISELIIDTDNIVASRCDPEIESLVDKRIL